MEISARHSELIHRLRELTRVIRMIRQRRAAERPNAPLGMVGLLMQFDETADPAVGCHAKELADRSGLDPSTVSRLVAALVAQGLVTRRTDPADRRASFLVPTAAGRAALADARNWYDDLLARALADWRPAEVEALASALERFVADLQRSLDPAAAPNHRRGDDVPTDSHHKLEVAR